MENLDLKQPIFECVSIIKKGESGEVKNGNCLVPFGIEENVALTSSASSNSFVSSRASLNESITNPSRKSFLNSRLLELGKVYSELPFDNMKAVMSAYTLLNICAQNKKFSVTVSKSDDNEILIYTREKNKFKNILIDGDGDIHYILIGNKLGEEDSAYFSSESELDYNHIASLI